ncbi:putative glutathione transferase [Helianthus annuus]|nr:putative glutathione transferase [Helianthus annuus]
MDPPYSNFSLNLGDSEDYSNTQYYQNSPFFSNSNQVPVTENLRTSQKKEKQSRGTKWDVAEDVALMSAWCLASENSVSGKNQRKESLWAKIKDIYDATQKENPEKIGMRNLEQMKGRYKRLNESVQKWVGVYREACRQTRSGMSQNDIESLAQKLYENVISSMTYIFVIYFASKTNRFQIKILIVIIFNAFMDKQ